MNTKNNNVITSVFCWFWATRNLSNKHDRVGKWITEFLKKQSMSSAHRVDALLCHFLGHRHSQNSKCSLDYLTPLWVWPALIVHQCHIRNFKETNAVTKAAHKSSISVISNLTSKEKHVHESNSALLYKAVQLDKLPEFHSNCPRNANTEPFLASV